MAVDKNRVVAEATKLVQKGQFDKAIRQYEKLVADDPGDVRILLKIGELQQKKGDNPGAAATFGRVAEAYGEQGFFLKAVAVYKQMLKLAPEDSRVNERLAGLYQQLGILSDAMAQLQVVASAAERAGDEAKLLDVLRRMVELEPDNVGSAVKLGELYAKQDKPKLALEHLRRAAQHLKRNNRADEYLKVAERISFLDPSDLGLVRELAHIYLAKGDTKRALAKLQLCFKADPKDADTLKLLAQAFKDLGQTTKTVSVYKELAHLQAERGQAEEVRATWRKVQELAPDDPEASAALAAAAPRPAAAPARPAAPPPRAPAPGRPPGAAPTPAPVPAPVQAGRPAPTPVARPAPPAASSSGPEAIPKLLTETDVYVKYGLHQKALEHLGRVFAIDPEHLEGREKALQIRAARGDTTGAAGEAAHVARIALARGLAERAAAAVARLRELAPDHPLLSELAGQVGREAEEEVVVEPEDEVVLEVEAPLEEDDLALHAARGTHDALAREEVVSDEELTDVAGVGPLAPPLPPAEPPEPPRPPRPPSRPAIAPTLVIGPPPLRAAPPAAELDAAPPFPEPEASVERTPPFPIPAADFPPPFAPPPSAVRPPSVARPPAVPAPPPAKPPPVAAPPPRAVAPPPAIAPPPPVVAPPPAAVAPPPPPSRDEEEDLDSELAEAEFFAGQGLLDEAREALQNLLQFYPRHGGVRAALAALDARTAAGAEPEPGSEAESLAEPAPAAAPEPAAPPAAPPAALSPRAVPAALSLAEEIPDDGFDIARELAEELGAVPPGPGPETFQYSVEDVFSQFKRGVAETVRPEDSDTHYDLGIAYKEMGLIDDALHEFEVALQGRARAKEIDCLTMLALCRSEKGDLAGALEAYRRALRSDYLTPEAARAIHYEIASVHRVRGDREAALLHLQKVLKLDPGFRDAQALASQLVAAGVRVEAEPPAGPGRGPKKNIGFL